MERWEPDSDGDTDDRTGDVERYYSGISCQLDLVLHNTEKWFVIIESGNSPFNWQFRNNFY
jgi:hypothetical protein